MEDLDSIDGINSTRGGTGDGGTGCVVPKTRHCVGPTCSM